MSTIKFSTDSITWTTASITYSADATGSTAYIASTVANAQITGLENIKYSWVATADNGLILKSSQNADDLGTFQAIYNRKGIDWISRNANVLDTLAAVAYGNGLWLAGAYFGHLRSSTDTITWTTVNTSFGSSHIFAIAYGNSTYVIAGSAGKVSYSTNGTSWSDGVSQFGSTIIRSIAYGNGLWIITGDNGYLASATHPSSWTLRTSGFGNSAILSSDYGNGLFAAAGQSGKIFTSTDTVTWTQRTSGTTNNINDIAYGNGKWMVVGNSGYVASSTDAITWVTQNSMFGNTMILTIDYADGLWMAGGRYGSSNNLAYSTNGVSWTIATTPSTYASGVRDAAYGNGSWVVVSPGNRMISSSNSTIVPSISKVARTKNNKMFYTVSNNKKYISSDFYTYSESNWSKASLSWSSSIQSLYYANGLWVAVGDMGQLSTSTNMVSWSARAANMGTSTIRTTFYGNGVWAIAGNSGQLRTSTDAVTWITAAATTFGTTNINSLVYADNKWVAVGNYGQIRTSTDLTTWTTSVSNMPVAYGGSVRDVAYGNGKWIAVGYSGNVRSSTDAITWATVSATNFGSSNIMTVAYGNGMWVFAGTNSSIRYSTDAVTWNTATITPGLTAQVNNVAYANNLWMAVGTNGYVATSTDAMTWTTQNSTFATTFTSYIYGLAYGGGAWGSAGTANNAPTLQFSSQSSRPVNNIVLLGTDNVVLANSGYMEFYENENLKRVINTGINDNFVNIAKDSSNRYVVEGQNGIYSSTDLLSWTTIAIADTQPSSINDIIAL